MCYDSSCKHTRAGAALAPALTGVQGSSLQHWSETLVSSQRIRDINDLMDSQMIKAPSCLAIQLIRTGFSYLIVILVMPTTRHRHIFSLQYQCT